jgi:hypothetical protein
MIRSITAGILRWSSISTSGTDGEITTGVTAGILITDRIIVTIITIISTIIHPVTLQDNTLQTGALNMTETMADTQGANQCLPDHNLRQGLLCPQGAEVQSRRTAGVKGHSVHLQEVHHPPGRHHMSEVLLQEDPDHRLRDRLPQTQNHQKDPPPEVRAGGNTFIINEGHMLHVLFH